METENEMSELEKEFQQIYNSIDPLIQEQLRLADEHMKEAVRLAEAHGIPFDTEYNQMYYPKSFYTNFYELVEEAREDGSVLQINKSYIRIPYEDDSSGWINSSYMC